MGYNVIDLINRCIQIEDIKLKYLEELIEKKKNEPTVQIMCKVFLKDSISSRSFYKNLKEDLDASKIDEIHIMTYDKISFLFNEFIKKIYVPDLNSPRKYLLFALDLAEDLSLKEALQMCVAYNVSDDELIVQEMLEMIDSVVA